MVNFLTFDISFLLINCYFMRMPPSAVSKTIISNKQLIWVFMSAGVTERQRTAETEEEENDKCKEINEQD